MSVLPLVAFCCLIGAALVVAWPTGRRRERRAAVLTMPPALPDQGRISGPWLGLVRRAWRPSTRLMRGRAPRGAILIVAGVLAAGVALAAGPVAAVCAGGYGAAALFAWRRRAGARLAAARRARRLDEVGALAADLRAGLPPALAGRPATDEDAGGPSDRLAELTSAARRLADRTGAPLADLLDRIEADARAADRARVAAAAQAAGARATAMLLAGLPAAGIGLGYAMGADPLQVLLHTPLGGACAVTAMGLQLGGLAWSQRLVRIEPAG
jgi:tight adherence protein B